MQRAVEGGHPAPAACEPGENVCLHRAAPVPAVPAQAGTGENVASLTSQTHAVLGALFLDTFR